MLRSGENGQALGERKSEVPECARKLIGELGGKCSNPKCRKEVLGDASFFIFNRNLYHDPRCASI